MSLRIDKSENLQTSLSKMHSLLIVYKRWVFLTIKEKNRLHFLFYSTTLLIPLRWNCALPQQNNPLHLGTCMRLKRLLLLISVPVALCVLSFVILSLIFPLPASKHYSLVLYDQHGVFLSAFLTDYGMWRLKTYPDGWASSLGSPHAARRLLHVRDKQVYPSP